MLEAQPEPGGAVRSAPLTAARLRPRPLQRVLSARRRLAAHAPAAAGGARAALARGAGRRRRPAPRRPRRAPLPRPRRDGASVAPTRPATAPRGASSPRGGTPSARASWTRSWTRSRPCATGRACWARSADRARCSSSPASACSPVRRFAGERFRGDAAGRLLAGNALHADIGARHAGRRRSSAGPGRPRAGVRLARARGRRRAAHGRAGRAAAQQGRPGRVRRAGRAGPRARTAGRRRALRGRREAEARRAVLADTGAPRCTSTSSAREHVPARSARRPGRASSTTSARSRSTGRWTGRSPGRRRDERARGPCTYRRPGRAHRAGRRARARLVPDRPFLIVGQYDALRPDALSPPARRRRGPTRTSPSRCGATSGDGSRALGRARAEAIAARMEARVERLAPGFGALVRGRHVAGPRELEAADANLVGGALNGGTAQLHQQLVFRPTRASAAPRRRSAGSTWRPPRRTRAAGCTARRAPTPPVRRWRMRASRGGERTVRHRCGRGQPNVTFWRFSGSILTE